MAGVWIAVRDGCLKTLLGDSAILEHFGVVDRYFLMYSEDGAVLGADFIFFICANFLHTGLYLSDGGFSTTTLVVLFFFWFVFCFLLFWLSLLVVIVVN